MEITKFDLEKWYVEFEFKSKYNLSASGIKPLKLNQINNLTAFYNLNITYSPANGNDKLISLLAEIHNVNKENILITNGAIEGVFLTQLHLFNPNDNIIVVKPTYPALYEIAKDIGANIIDWELDFDDNFSPDTQKLNLLMETYKPKALIINFPNNPTGAKLNYRKKKEIIDICKKYDCYLISDEVYSNLDLDSEMDYPYYNKKITINSLSKTFGLAGLRIGWLIADSNIINELTNIRHYTTLCNNIISETIAFDVLNNKDKYIENSLSVLKNNKKITCDYLDKLQENGKIKYVKPKAGLMIFPKLINTDDSEKFCRDFEDKTSILLLPGNKYGEKYKKYFRLGFGIDTDNLIYCLKNLEEFLLN